MWNAVVCYGGMSELPGVDLSQPIYYNRQKSLWMWKVSSAMGNTNWSSYAGNWVISTTFPPEPVLGGAQVSMFSEFNSKPVYSVGGSSFLWTDGSSWYHSPVVGGGTAEWVNEDAPSVYMGDAFFYGSLYYSPLTGGGSNHGGTETVSFAAFMGWYWDSGKSGSSTVPYGVYTAAGGATGTQYVGALVLTDSAGNTYTQQPTDDSLALLQDGYVHYSTLSSDKTADKGDISFEATTLNRWIIGTYSTTAGTGYWKGPATLPKASTDAAATFQRIWNDTTPSSSDPAPGDLTLSFSKWQAPTTSWKKPGLFLESGVTFP